MYRNDPTLAAPAARRRRGRGLLLVVPLVAAAFGVALAATLVGLLQNPFGTTVHEEPNAVVLARLEDLSRYEAATGRFETLVDQEQDANLLPDWVKGERTVLSAEGDVEAYVDLGDLDAGAIEVSADGNEVTVHLPPPTLQDPRLDLSTTRVISRDRGLVDRVDDALTGGNPSADEALFARAEEKLAEAAAQSDLLSRAERNTTTLVTDLLTAAGFEGVTVVYDGVVAAPDAAA